MFRDASSGADLRPPAGQYGIPCAGPRPDVYGARVAKRNRRSRRPAGRTRSRPARREPPRDEPGLLARITDTLGSDDPLPLLALASTLPAVTDPRGRSPLAGPSDGPNRDQLIESFLGVPLDDVVEHLTVAAGSDPGTTARPRGPADARAQIGAAVELGTAHFGGGNGAISQRSEPILRAIGVEPQQPYGRKDLGSPRYMTGTRRSAILADRDRYRARAGAR